MATNGILSFPAPRNGVEADWGPPTSPVQRGGQPVGTEGNITRPSPSSLTGAPTHPVSYSATDSRHNLETGFRPWTSVDVNSGPTSHDDFGSLAGRFADGPGVWRQT